MKLRPPSPGSRLLPVLLLSAFAVSHSALALGTTTLGVSWAADESAALTGARADRPSTSADGRYVAFISNARNFGGDTGGKRQVFVRDRVLGTTSLASVSSGGVPADQDCYRVALSADGRHVAFSSPSRNLAPNLNPVAISTFVRDLDTGQTELASVNSQEMEPGAFHGTEGLALSAEGRYVAFTSDATDLAPGDTNTHYDVFVRDRVAGTTELGSVEPAGVPSDFRSGTKGLALSADGRYLVFHSQDTSGIGIGGRESIFLRDRQQGSTELISVTGAGVEGNGPSTSPSLSADGRYVAFQSEASDLVPGDTNGYDDVFVRDRLTAATERVSLSSAGAQGTHRSAQPALSPDGRYVAFWSLARTLPQPPYTAFWDAYVHDRVSGATEMISLGAGGELPDRGSIYVPDAPSVSQGGVDVTFVSPARNLVAGDTNGKQDVFVRRRVENSTERVSVGPGGVEGTTGAQSSAPALSGNGRYVAFVSDAFNLVAGDTNGEPDVFVWDRSSGSTERVSVAADGTQGNAPSAAEQEFTTFYPPSLSADGRYVAFASWASNLVPFDSNEWCDVFVRDRTQGSTERVSLRADGAQVIAAPEQTPALSADGRYVAFITVDAVIPEDQDYLFDVYVRDRATQSVRYASSAADGDSSDGSAYSPALSGDGRYVAFVSNSTNLVAGDVNNVSDIFVRDLQTNSMERVSVSTGGQAANEGSYSPSLNADGRYVAFSSDASNLVGGGPAGRGVYVRDRVGSTTERLNLSSGIDGLVGTPADHPRLSADGRFVAFSAYVDFLVNGDTNNATDIFVRDRSLHVTERVSVAADGAQGNPTPNFLRLDVPAISADGRLVAWQSDASNLVSGDMNGSLDVFLRDRGYQSVLQPPASLTAQTVAPFGIRLTWTDSNSDESSQYVERRTSALGTFEPLATLGANVTSYEDATVAPGTTYYYRVFASNADGNSPYSNLVSVTLPGLPAAPQVTIPAAQSSASLRIDWEVSDDGILSFQVERSADDGDTWTLIAEPGGDVTSLDDLGLLPNQRYLYRVRARNLAGYSPFGEATGWTLPLPPAAPTNLQVGQRYYQLILLTWSRPSGPVSGYTIERRQGKAAFTQVASTQTEQIFASDLDPGATYSFRVRAYNDSGTSEPSSAVTATTLSDPGKLTVSVKKINFGAVRIGKTVQRALVIKNSSRTDSLWIRLSVPQAPFGLVTEVTRNLTPGQKWKPMLTFQPGARGPFSQTWTLTSTDPRQPSKVITLVGKGK